MANAPATHSKHNLRRQELFRFSTILQVDGVLSTPR